MLYSSPAGQDTSGPAADGGLTTDGQRVNNGPAAGRSCESAGWAHPVGKPGASASSVFGAADGVGRTARRPAAT